MKVTILLPLAGIAALWAAEPALAGDACAGKPGGGAVQLTVRNVALRDAEGQVAVTLYPDNPRRFLAPRGKLLRLRVPAAAPTTSVCFWVQPGFYAVAVYHDQNADRDFNRNLVGMPAEGFGFSNDAPTRFSLPSFDAVRFRVPAGGRTITVKMRYPS